jgi:arylsulfatase A-like enzyme
LAVRSRRGVWVAVAAGLALTALAAWWRPASTAAPQYNVILVSLDTLRQDRLNAYGYERRRVSPNLDALAADGIVFENAIAASPWTTPAHLSLLTSVSPSRHGVMASFLDTLDQIRRRRFERLPDSYTTLAEALAGHGLATAAFTGGATLHPSLGFSQGFAVYDTSMFKLDDENMGRLKDWIDAHRETPFFVFWHTFETHDPYLETTFVGDAVPPRTAVRVRELVGEVRRHFARGRALPDAAARFEAFGRSTRAISSALYDGGILSADRRVGELVGHLRQAGLYDRTLLVVTSDHGEELGERGPAGFFGSHGHTLYDELLSVPLIVKLPGQRHAGRRVAAVVRAIDVMPTVLEVLGIPRGPALEGRSLRPLWRGEEAGRRVAFSEALAFGEEKKSARTDRYKLILTVPAPDVVRRGRRGAPAWPVGRELYDLQEDPAETRNLVAGTGRHPVAEELEAPLREHLGDYAESPALAELPAETVEQLRALGYID